MTITYHPEVVQGSDEWHQMRCGLLTASEIKLILTPTLRIANNDKTRAHIYELLAQRITGYVEPSYISDDMLRGWDDEIEAVRLYSEKFGEAQKCGFVTNDQWGFKIGYSPDALVGSNGLLECKSRRAKFQVQTISDNTMPDDFMLQVQTGLLVTGREWLDFISYSGGLPMIVLRVHPIPEVQEAIIEAAIQFEATIADKEREYWATLAHHETRAVPTERKVEVEMFV